MSVFHYRVCKGIAKLYRVALFHLLRRDNLEKEYFDEFVRYHHVIFKNEKQFQQYIENILKYRIEVCCLDTFGNFSLKILKTESLFFMVSVSFDWSSTKLGHVVWKRFADEFFNYVNTQLESYTNYLLDTLPKEQEL